MTTNGIDIVEQLRGRMKFFQVGDPVRRDMQTACEVIEGQRLTAISVRAWLEGRGVKLTPKQRQTLGLDD